MIYEQRSKNLWTSRVIGTSFVAVVVFIIYCAVVLISGGDAFIFALALTVVGVLMIVGYLKSDRWVLGRFSSQFLEPSREAREELEEMSIAAGIPTPVLYVLDTGTLNAFALGREPRAGIVVVTKGLVEDLSRDELAAVFAHEVAHIRDGDSMAGGLIALMVRAGNWIFAGSFVLLYLMAHSPEIITQAPVLFLLPVACFALPIGGRLAQMAFSRSREYLADNSAVLLARNPEGLIGALRLLEERSSVVKRAGVAESHLFIARPDSIWNLELFTTHPPIEKRIEALYHVTAVPVPHTPT